MASSPRLADKVLVVIGGTSGLGLSAATACVREGARLVVVGRGEAKVQACIKVLGAACRGLAGDATMPETAARAIETALCSFGRFDGLYHVAGGSGRAQGDGPLDQASDAGWSFTLEENLTSLFYSNRAAVRQFLAQQTMGSVLNMTSVLGVAPAPAHFATHAYAAAKAGAIGLTRSAAAYYARHNIRFNALAPALVETPMSQRALGSPEALAYVSRRQPLDGGRVGRPADLDAAVVYFLSDESRYVTGQVLAVDGGWTVSDAG